MSDKLEIRITGNATGASSAFKTVTADAQKMGTAVEQAGEKSTRSLQGFNQRAAAFGAALGGATLLMGEFARAAAEDEASQQRLEQSVTNTGASVDAYSASLEAAIKSGQQKAFSDDQTRDAMVKLNLATNDTQKSIDQLGLAMDLSRAKGISLSQSAEIIGKVYQGQYGALSRMGIILDANATKEEALAEIQKRVAGQAQTYAETQVGQIDILKDKIGEMTEAWGAHAGALQQVALLLPGLQAGYVALAGAIGGIGGLGALGALAPIAIGAGGAFLIADAIRTRENTGSSLPFTAVNYGLYGAGSALNAALPGNPFDTQKYMDTLASNSVEDAVKGLFYFAPTDKVDNQALYDRLVTAGIAPSTGGDVSNKEIEKFFLGLKESAGSVGMSTGKYISSYLGAPGSNFVFDQVSGRWMDLGEQQIYQQARTAAASAAIQSRAQNWALSPGTSGLAGAAGVAPTTPWFPYRPGANPQADYVGGRLRPNADFYEPPGAAYGAPSGATFIGAWQGWGTPGPFTHRGSTRGATSGGMDTGAAPTDIGARFQTGTPFPAAAPSFFRDADLDIINAAKLEAALRDELGAYYHLADGINSAKEASSTFKGVQDSLIESEGVYGQQISEFGSQVSAVEAAHEVLNRRVAEGGKLTQEQQEFQDNYNKAIERGKGAIDDATVSQGLLGESYLLNMEKGDQINDIMKETADSTRDLVTVIEDLILSMEGIPPEVKTRIELERAQEAKDELQSVIDKLNALDGRTATFYVEASGSGLGVSVGRPGGPGIQESLTGLHGGVVGYNNGGVVIRAGEAGPEHMSFANGGSAWAMTDSLYNVPRGTYVTPAPASRGRGGGNGLHFNGPVSITVVANDPRQMAAAINEWAVGSSRS